MTRYIAILDQADGQFGVAIPDAPGCSAMGATTEEALENAREALTEWVADRIAVGEAAPAARSLAEILEAEPDLADDLRAGAVMAMVPLILHTGRTVRANLSLDAGILADIDQAAHRLGVTRSAFLTAAAIEKMKADA